MNEVSTNSQTPEHLRLFDVGALEATIHDHQEDPETRDALIKHIARENPRFAILIGEYAHQQLVDKVPADEASIKTALAIVGAFEKVQSSEAFEMSLPFGEHDEPPDKPAEAKKIRPWHIFGRSAAALMVLALHRPKVPEREI